MSTLEEEGPTFRWLGVKLNARDALQASQYLFAAIKEALAPTVQGGTSIAPKLPLTSEWYLRSAALTPSAIPPSRLTEPIGSDASAHLRTFSFDPLRTRAYMLGNHRISTLLGERKIDVPAGPLGRRNSRVPGRVRESDSRI